MQQYPSNDSKKTLGEQAYEAIREAILSVQLKPGQAIYESELGQILNMSRTPIREAVRKLLVEELVEVLPQRGMKVALISESKVEDTRYVREVLEIGGLRKTIHLCKSSDHVFEGLLRSVKLNLEEQHRASELKDESKFMQADEMFHRLLLSAGGNPTLVSVVSQMRGHLNRVRLLSLDRVRNVGALIKEHQAIVRALESGVEDDAVDLLAEHLRHLSSDIQLVKERYPSYFAEN